MGQILLSRAATTEAVFPTSRYGGEMLTPLLLVF